MYVQCSECSQTRNATATAAAVLLPRPLFQRFRFPACPVAVALSIFAAAVTAVCLGSRIWHTVRRLGSAKFETCRRGPGTERVKCMGCSKRLRGELAPAVLPLGGYTCLAIEPS